MAGGNLCIFNLNGTNVFNENSRYSDGLAQSTDSRLLKKFFDISFNSNGT